VNEDVKFALAALETYKEWLEKYPELRDDAFDSSIVIESIEVVLNHLRGE